MQATVELLDLKPAAIEHVDRVLFDQTKGQVHSKPRATCSNSMPGPAKRSSIVEFYERRRRSARRLEQKRLGLRTTLVTGARRMNLVWALRKAGPVAAHRLHGRRQTGHRASRTPRCGRNICRRMSPAWNPSSTARPEGVLLRPRRLRACCMSGRCSICTSRRGLEEVPPVATKFPRWCGSSKARSPPSTAWASRAPSSCRNTWATLAQRDAANQDGVRSAQRL